MIKILFVCHGNICRSPMAEYLFKYLVKENNLENEFYIESAATSFEELGRPIHQGTKRVLDKYNIDYSKKRARQIKQDDYENFDYIIGMDKYNRKNLISYFNGDPKRKVSLLLDYTSTPKDVIDPWYSNNFEATHDDIMLGLNCFLMFIKTMKKW